MKIFNDHDQLRLASILVGGLVLAGLATMLGENAVQRSFRDAASATASQLAVFLAASIPDLDILVDRGEVSTRARAFVDHTASAGVLVHYRIFDLGGKVRLDSGRFPEDDDIDGHDDFAAAIETARTGITTLNVGRGDGESLPLLYAEAYVPLVLDGRKRGAIEVYVDQTERIGEIRALFLWTGLGIAGLTALAFLLPLGAYLLKSREAREEITFVSKHDDLTQLANRSAFKTIVEGHIHDGYPFDVFFVDLDRFKSINDSRGHAFGDAMLRIVASRLQEVAGPTGLVARFGGDEFVIYHPVETERDNRELGNQIVAALSRCYLIDGTESVIGASVGVASSPRDGTTVGALLKAADIALYEAKQSGRGRVVRFERTMEEQVRNRVALEARLRSAVANHEFAIYYQPLLDPKKLGGFEALLRLWDDAGEPIPPSIFIPVAEQIGLIGTIGAETLRGACSSAALWPDDLRVAVNLSALQFESGDLVGIVREALATSGLPARRLELEITESVLIAEAASVVRQLQELKALGVSIALDDFGTGYSSLSYLWMFQFDRVKVDRSFVGRLSEEDAKAREMLASILALGRSLEMSITAEGVETVAQSVILRSMKVDTVQGYLYSKPIPEIELAATILRLRDGYHSPTVDLSVVSPAVTKRRA